MPGTGLDTATYLAYATGWRAVRLMPERAAYAMFQQIADQQWRARGKGVRQLERNLTRVGRAGGGGGAPGAVPPRHALLHAVLVRRVPAAGLVPGADRLVRPAALRADHRAARPGPWGGLRAAAPGQLGPRGGRTSVANTRRWSRSPSGWSPRGSTTRSSGSASPSACASWALGEPGVFDELARTLDAGGFVPLLADRDLSAKGIEVTFFGEPTRFPAGPAAPRGGHWRGPAPGRACAGRRPASTPSGNNVAEILPEVVPPSTGERSERIRAATQEVANALEGAIRAHPDDWHMLQKLWLADLDPARLAARDAAAPSAGDGEADR